MARRKRSPGQIEELPSGSLRVKVFAGKDPLTGRRRYLSETIPADQPDPKKTARKSLNRLVNEVDERRYASQDTPSPKVETSTRWDPCVVALDAHGSERIGSG